MSQDKLKSIHEAVDVLTGTLSKEFPELPVEFFKLVEKFIVVQLRIREVL